MGVSQDQPDPYGGAAPGSGDSGSGPIIRQGADGQYYQLGPDGTWHLITGMPSKADTAKQVPYRKTASEYILNGPIDIGPKPIQFNTQYGSADPASPEGLAAVNDAYTRVLDHLNSGMTPDPVDLMTLKAAGVATPSATALYGGGGGAGGGITAYQSAQLANSDRAFQYQAAQDAIALERQKRQDALQASIDYINGLVAQQQEADARAKAAQSATLDALPYVMPRGMTSAPGFGPNSAAVRYGLVDPVPLTPVAFNPSALTQPGQYDAEIHRRLAALQGYGVPA